MDTPTPREKGNILEAAVAAIEWHILDTSPNLREKTFVIESKKIVNVGDVHHEIDIFVTIDLGQGYKSIFIFECKNWRDAVGKDPVIVFSEKVKAIGATRGFMVARSFTKDAEAQAEKDERLTLVLASEKDPATTPLPVDLHSIITIPERIDITFHRRGSSRGEYRDVPMESSQVRVNGEVIELRQYVSEWSDKLCANDVLGFRTEKLPEGDYPRTASTNRHFDTNLISLDGDDIEQAEMTIRYNVRVLRPAVISSYEVQSRGHYILLSPIKLPTGAVMQMSVTTRT